MSNLNTIPAVEKAVAILTRLGECEEGMTQSELAEELDIAPSSCYRILQTLLNSDWIRRAGGTRYDLSTGLLAMVRKLTDQAARFESVMPFLEKLARETGLCCKLSVRQGSFQMTILRAESPRPLAVSSRIGVRFPVIEGSVGAALLSRTPAPEIQQLARNCVEEIGERSHPELILGGIDAIRKAGYCFNRGRNRWKVDAMSAPVPDRHGNIAAALTLLGYDDDFSEEILPELAAALLRTAELCENAIGYAGGESDVRN